MNDGVVNITNSADIDQALKEFEAQSAPQKEGGVTFETDTVATPKQYEETAMPKMVRLVIKYSGGAIKDQRMAEYVLFGFVIIFMGISLYLFFGGNRRQQPSATAVEQMQQMQTTISH